MSPTEVIALIRELNAIRMDLIPAICGGKVETVSAVDERISALTRRICDGQLKLLSSAPAAGDQ